MVSKKYFSLMVVLLVLTQTVSFGQTTDLSTNWGWNWLDSSKIAPAKMPQYNAFASNEYPYPARPRDQWELGIGLGTAILSNTWGQDAGFGATLTLRKALNHTFSLRPYLAYYTNSGSGNDDKGNSISYKDNSFHIGMDVLTSLNTASYYRGNPKVNIYLITGLEYFNPSLKQSINGGAYNTFTLTSNNTVLITDILILILINIQELMMLGGMLEQN